MHADGIKGFDSSCLAVTDLIGVIKTEIGANAALVKAAAITVN